MAAASGIACVGVVAALDWEADVFSATRAGALELLIETTGPGAEAAAAGAERALARGADVLISWGSAGALGSAEPGEIVIPRGILDTKLQRFAADAYLSDALADALGEVANMYRADLVSADSPVATLAAKRQLAEASGAIAVDMESAAIAGVAACAGVPLGVLRVIVDGQNHCVPPCAIAGMDGARSRPGRVLAGLLKSPSDAPACWCWQWPHGARAERWSGVRQNFRLRSAGAPAVLEPNRDSA